MDKNIRLLSENINDTESTNLSDRISFAKKKANDYKWAKEKTNYYDLFNNTNTWSAKSERINRNYDLYNGVIDEEIFKPITNALNIEDFENPVKMEHIDIISLPLREIIGSEIKRPFEPIAVAINPEALSKREDDRINMLKQYIYTELMWPIEEELNQKYPNKDTDEKQAKLYAEDLQAMKPEEIDDFMATKHRLPEESLAQDLIEYLNKEHRLEFVFNKGWEKAVLSGEEIYYVGQKNGKEYIEVIDNRYFNYDKSSQSFFIQDSEWCTYERFMLISDIYEEFAEEIQNDKKLQDRLENLVPYKNKQKFDQGILLDYNYDDRAVELSDRRIRVLHTVFKSLKKIKFITTQDPETGQTVEMVVDEAYKFNPLLDLEERVAWIPEYWETTKIDEDIFCRMQPLPYQYRNIHDPFKIHGPYVGAVYGIHNGVPISLTDRGYAFQFLYDVIWFRLMETLSTDRGNILLAVLKQIPKGWSPKQWLQYMITTKVGFLDTTQDVSPVGSDPQYWKSINLSNNADIQKYLNLLDYCEQRCLRAIGSNENRIGTVSPTESVSNNQQKIIQSSNVTEPEFYLHNIVKEEVITALLEQAKISFRNNPRNITYITSDLNIKALTVDPELLETSEYAVYSSNSTKDHSIVQTLRNQIDRIVQASQGDFRFLTELVTTNNPQSLKEMADKVSQEKDEQMKSQQEAQQKQMEMQQQMQQQQMQFEKEEKQLDREYRLKEAMIKALGFSKGADVDTNKVPDALEVAKFNAELALNDVDKNMKTRELDIRERELVENNLSEREDRQIQKEKIKADLEKERIKAGARNATKKN